MRKLTCFLALAVSFFALCAPAQLPTYGVVVGTLVHDANTDIRTTKNPHLEPQQSEGHYPHYMFYVDSPSGQYQCVIDIFSRASTTERKPIRYRVVPLHAGNHDWDTILNFANGFQSLPKDFSHGALDYFRHPGLNLDARTIPWTEDPNFVVGVNLPAFDDLFLNVRRVWAFGQPYSTGRGIHNIHQNQGNVPSSVLQAPQGPTGEDHSGANGLWQDGAVLLEYDPQLIWVPARNRWWFGNIFIGRSIWNLRDKVLSSYRGHFELRPNRKLLMTQFQVQEDFTYDTTGVHDGINLKAGDGYTPLTLSDFSISANNVSIVAGEPPMNGQFSTSSGSSKKTQITVIPRSGHPVLYGRVGAPPTPFSYNARSAAGIGETEIIHNYSPTPQTWYWRVYNTGVGACTFDWREFDASE